MKLLIDIPDHIYEHAKEMTEDSRDEGEAMRAIANGTQPESRSEIPNTCGDAISRQAVLDGLARIAKAKAKSDAQKSLMGRVMFFTEQLPSVTPHPKIGRWIKEGQGGRYKWMCSNCGTHHRALYDFCPSCGTKMEVEE
jgi:rubrerythrin